MRNIFFGFSHCDGWLREFGPCFPSYLYFCETGSHGWIIYIYAFSRRFYPKQLKMHSGYSFFYVCSLEIEPTTFCAANAMLYQRATWTPTCFQRLLEKKNIYFIIIFSPILNSYYPMKGSFFCDFYFYKISKGLTKHINVHSLLWSYLSKRTYIVGHDCICICKYVSNFN